LIPSGVAPRIQEVRLTEAITQLVQANLGISALARWAVEPLLDAGAIVALPIPQRGLQRRWSAVLPKDLARAEHVAEFIDLLARNGPGIGAKRRRTKN
jgi:LysR family transcriptional regulator for metE and metH